MKTLRSPRQTRAVREQKRVTQDCEQALRACEEAATRIQAAGNELAACWKTLCQSLSTGVSATELLRARAWCNVLELRLKEQAHALEDARHGVDAVWEDVMLNKGARDLFHRLLHHNPRRPLSLNPSWPMFADSAAGARSAGAVSPKS